MLRTITGIIWIEFKYFTKEIPDRIRDLEDYGLLFERKKDGDFYTWRGGKQTESLNVCVGDYTGREMMQALVDQLRKLSATYFDEFFVSKLMAEKGEVKGVFGFDLKSGDYVLFKAPATILATGGAERMYRVTTNAASNTGDGYAMALDVEAELVDMEMIQFHPTGMVFPESARGLLVTEKVRGHGGQLINIKGERFLKNYYPEKMELAGRDEIARSIYQEVKEGRGTKNGGVYLDTIHWSKGEVEDKIPDVFEQYMNVGVDIRKKPMEVYPTMHHVCGGVKINEDGETNVAGLYGVGEVVGGIHGANRLGGNSIADGQVFGRRAAIAAAKLAKKVKHKGLIGGGLGVLAKKEINRIERFLKRKKGVDTYEVEEQLKDVMWDNVGIVRDDKRLKKAEKKVGEFKRLAKKVKVKILNKRRNKELQDALELRNMIVTAEAIIKPALLRKESRGAHSRIDYVKKDDKFFKNIIVKSQNAVMVTRTATPRRVKRW